MKTIKVSFFETNNLKNQNNSTENLSWKELLGLSVSDLSLTGIIVYHSEDCITKGNQT